MNNSKRLHGGDTWHKILFSDFFFPLHNKQKSLRIRTPTSRGGRAVEIHGERLKSKIKTGDASKDWEAY